VALVETSTDGAVALLTLNRPEARNALSIEMCDAIVEALHVVDAMSGARAVVVQGEGPIFCSGADFAAVSGPAGVDFLPAFERMLETTARHRLPTIAAIHGAALGGGFQLATACDFRIAADDARIGIPSSRLGILVNFENVRRLVLLAGIAVAKEVLMTGRTYSGPEAEAAGLVHRSVPATKAIETAGAMARDIAALAPLSVQGSKRAIQVVADDLSNPRAASPDEAALVDALVAEAYSSADLQEGVAALREKRQPRFRGE
jgi:enoyl-CoA hydratase/carnithine racemase